MSRHHFHKLLSRYRSGDCTDQEKRLVNQWFLLLDGEETNNSHLENQLVEERIWKTIQDKQAEPDFKKQRSLEFFNWRWAAAAVIFLGVFWGVYQFKKGSFLKKETELAARFPKGFLSKTNATNQAMVFYLHDSSEVRLLPKSSIQFPAAFENGKREVVLQGKAFFHVARNVEKPFFVYTGEVVTKVLGTSFWVNSNDDANSLEVSVVTGKVAVFQRGVKNNNMTEKIRSGVILTPNQRVNYSSDNKLFVASLVEQPVMPASYEKEFVFDDAPLTKVFGLFEKAYGIEIVLENKRLEGCLFTADIGKQPMFTKLDLICSSVNASYKVRGTKILVSGKGCQQTNP